MLGIGDFARLAGVSVRMLRHYDRLGLLTPARVDEWTGYRYYSASQLARANQLVATKELGFTLEEVGELLADDLREERLVDLLRERAAVLAERIDADQRRLLRVTARLRSIEKGNTMSTLTFTEVSMPALRLMQLATTVTEMEDIESEIGPMFRRVNAVIEQAGLTRTGPGVAHYTQTDDGLIAAAAEQIGDAPVPEGFTTGELPAVPQALATTYDADDLAGIQAAWQSLVVEVESRGLTPSGTCREIYHETPMDPGGTRWVVELQQPLA
ncbi:MerR family transcriptional regulator [Gordonia phthalatica]|uniref:HTH merR-type domain-containing protein n=1 Tax=Gordonia phthalatica TaxID=1136941 RepID=A0A0N9NIS3_9ACTN|nr:MerR family transcriptional regulator [Gordonia phthalatica]ALG85451.1 hypothetical protein ACH46_14425 [Gordonia phthalatica]